MRTEKHNQQKCCTTKWSKEQNKAPQEPRARRLVRSSQTTTPVPRFFQIEAELEGIYKAYKGPNPWSMENLAVIWN